MYFPSSRPSPRYHSSTTTTITMTRQQCSRPLTLVLHSAPPTTAAPRSAAGLVVKPCIKRQADAIAAQAVQVVPVPR
ncbi:hypothetical protein GGH95_004804, partial [Coemansia sp. RSA 1836]